MVAIRPNTQLGPEARDWPVDDVVDLFLASHHYRPDGDVEHQLQMFITDQDGPLRGVCDAADLATLGTTVRARVGALVTAGRNTA